ncbi:MAG: peptidase [Planctomycetota bacterium]
MKSPTSIAAAFVVSAFTVQSVQAALDIQIEFFADPDPALLPFFEDAAATWETLLVDHQDGFVTDTLLNSSAVAGTELSTVNVSVGFGEIDGPGGDSGTSILSGVVVDASGYLLASDVIVIFDQADLPGLVDSDLFDDAVRHVLAHALGFGGAIWIVNEVYVIDSGEFLGANATAVWNTTFGQPGTPDVELDGPGTIADDHWNDFDSSIIDDEGRPLEFELMTGFLAPLPGTTDTFISDLTLGSFQDIGYLAPIPEPASFGLLAGVSLLLRRRNWRQRRPISHHKRAFGARQKY